MSLNYVRYFDKLVDFQGIEKKKNLIRHFDGLPKIQYRHCRLDWKLGICQFFWTSSRSPCLANSTFHSFTFGLENGKHNSFLKFLASELLLRIRRQCFTSFPLGYKQILNSLLDVWSSMVGGLCRKQVKGDRIYDCGDHLPIFFLILGSNPMLLTDNF